MGFLSALLVVFIHLEHIPQNVNSVGWAVWYFVRQILAGTAVPFFFLISGYFLARHITEKGWWRTAVMQRARTLIIPFFIWCLIPFLLFTFIWPASLPGGECGRCELKVSSIAAAFGLHLYTLPEANRALWYVRGFFFLVLISPLVAFLVNKLKAWAILIVWVIYWGLNPGVYDSNLFWLSGRWQVFWKYVFPVEGIFYLTIGFYLQRYPISMSMSRKTSLLLGIIGCALGGVSGLIKVRGLDDCGYLASAAIPFVLMFIWSFTPRMPWPKIFVGNAFALYVIHPIVLKALSECELLPTDWRFCILEWALASCGALLIAICLRKALPRFATIAFGGR